MLFTKLDSVNFEHAFEHRGEYQFLTIPTINDKNQYLLSIVSFNANNRCKFAFVKNLEV